MRGIFRSILASLLFLPIAQGAEKDDRLKTLHAKIGAITELGSDFTQTVIRPLRNRKSESQGTAFFGTPNRFRWILKKPISEEFRFDGKTLMIIKPSEKIANRFAGLASETKEIQQIVSMVLDLKSLTSRYDLKSITKEGDLHKLVLTPIVMDSELREVEIDVGEPKFLVNRVKMNYESNFTEIVFSNQTKSVPAGIFDEKLPDDIKIKDLK